MKRMSRSSENGSSRPFRRLETRAGVVPMEGAGVVLPPPVQSGHQLVGELPLERRNRVGLVHRRNIAVAFAPAASFVGGRGHVSALRDAPLCHPLGTRC
jgi:hypothetical protein